MPARLNKISKAFATLGIVTEKPKKGSHWKLRRPGTRVYTIPAHRGPKTEIDDKYIDGACKHFGIEPAAFRALL